MSEKESVKRVDSSEDQIKQGGADKDAAQNKASNEAFDLLKSASQSAAKSTTDVKDGFIPGYIYKNAAEHLKEKSVQDQLHITPLQAEELAKQYKDNPAQFSEFLKSQSAITPREKTGNAERLTYDAKNKDKDEDLPGTLVRSENTPPVSDKDINAIHDTAGEFRSFMRDFMKRNSIDDKGINMVQSAHVGKDFNNAGWDGEHNRMIYGDGDKILFNTFIKPDVIAHEMAHGVTQYTSNLEYHNQSGALNESFSDCVGIAFKQHELHQKAERDDKEWIIGEGVFTWFIGGKGLRDMLNPGTAYESKLIGNDPQPADMAHYKQMSDDENNDYGGVHINSGIPNRAFAEAAIALGGESSDKPLAIWYKTNQKFGGDPKGPNTDFKTWANATIDTARELYGDDAAAKVRAAWETVGVLGAKASVSELPAEQKQVKGQAA
jgi:Zn-dependent metalloprotease